MRIIDENGNTLTHYDLTTGYLLPATAIREDALLIDNQTRWAWSEEDYEPVQMYLPRRETPVLPGQEARIAALEEQLAAAKILLGVTE
ncbi:MAG TPA: hypothetical protein IAC31_03265 [Candidatus Faecousia intestinigallinarum]|nr:hypothetical protein [Candidatus Faecousia intestinigallinarum]